MCECISGAIHLKIGESALGKGEALEWGRKWLLIAWIKTAVETESVEIDSGDNRLVRLAECELNESIEFNEIILSVAFFILEYQLFQIIILGYKLNFSKKCFRFSWN